jgi:hypothetical protein
VIRGGSPRFVRNRIAPQGVEHLSALPILAYVKLGDELHMQSRARVSLDCNVKTSFSVDEAGNIGIKPFLLIVRTDQIVTVHAHHPKRRV